MSRPVGLSEGSLAALQHLRETREINTVTLRYGDVPGVLVPEVAGNLTHDELLQSLPADEPRLIVHELSFASPERTRRHERLLISGCPRMPAGRRKRTRPGTTP
ncbi:hypothetical protein [Streptomyces sp. NBC_01006]|uniref:hypothetical protein n=1 Tax=Streptomyces sp. NBC_01006 TaxID=2903716 RepID=UPI0038660838